MTLAEIRRHLEQALVGLDALGRAAGRIDQQVLDLLAAADAGLSTDAITALVRRRRASVTETLRLMEQAHQIRRNAITRRWVLED